MIEQLEGQVCHRIQICTVPQMAFCTPPWSPTDDIMVSVPVLSEVLERLGLSNYLQHLTSHGFHDWETVLDIAEDDFASMGFKLGHRRILQREIATYRGVPSSESLETLTEPTRLSHAALEDLSLQHTSPPPRGKRRYRRHPRADPNAPKRPKTAYVNFADQLRTDPEIRSLSFVDIAKEVGRRWQTLSAEKKRVWESQAARAMQEYENQLDEYKRTESYRKYQVYLNDFKARQAPTTKLKRPSNSRVDSFVRDAPSRASTVSSDTSPSHQFFSIQGTDTELCHNALSLAFSELVCLRTEILPPGAHPYDEHHLPPEEPVRRAMHAFVQGTGSLLYMWTHSQVDGILDRIYRPSAPVDAMTIAECFVVAAMGAHYDLECFPDRVRTLLYASGTLQFSERTARADNLRTIRLLLAMSFHGILDKHMSARYLIAAGLQIARCSGPSPIHPVHGTWIKLFRSLIFVDSWLSYTLGYCSEVKPEDISVACTQQCADASDLKNGIHIHTSQLGLIAADVSRTLTSPEVSTADKISTLAAKLETWRTTLPPQLQLAELTSGDLSSMTKFEKRAALMVHIMYFGALILLYRQSLVAEVESYILTCPPPRYNSGTRDATQHINKCGDAGRQMASILSMFEYDGTLCKRCWLIIYWAFTACIVLLVVATIKLLEGRFQDVETDLSYARYCLGILEPCRYTEPLARRYLDIVLPLYDSVRDIHQRMFGRAKTSIFMLVEADPNQSPPIPVNREVQPVLQNLCGLITDPFGRLQHGTGKEGGRRILNSDGSYSVFWWR